MRKCQTLPINVVILNTGMRNTRSRLPGKLRDWSGRHILSGHGGTASLKPTSGKGSEWMLPRALRFIVRDDKIGHIMLRTGLSITKQHRCVFSRTGTQKQQSSLYRQFSDFFALSPTRSHRLFSSPSLRLINPIIFQIFAPYHFSHPAPGTLKSLQFKGLEVWPLRIIFSRRASLK